LVYQWYILKPSPANQHRCGKPWKTHLHVVHFPPNVVENPSTHGGILRSTSDVTSGGELEDSEDSAWPNFEATGAETGRVKTLSGHLWRVSDGKI
jgi:hypothetical protein